MDNQQPKHNDKDKPFDPIAELVVPGLAKLSQENVIFHMFMSYTHYLRWAYSALCLR